MQKQIKTTPPRCENLSPRRWRIKSEWFIVIFIILAVALISSIPFIVRYFYAQDNSLYYLGNFFSVTDINSYFAKMLEAKNTAGWLLYNRYTTESHQPIFVFVFWIILGKIAKILNLSVYSIYQLVRIFAGMFFLFTFYWFCGYFLKGFKQKLYTLLLVIFSTGISGLFYLAYFKNNFDRNLIPPDFWGIPEQPIWRFFLHPHIALAMALVLISIIFLLKNELKFAFYASLINLVTAMIAPHHLMLLMVSISIYWLLARKLMFRCLLISFLPSLLYLIYLYFSVNNNLGWAVLFWQKYCGDIAIWKIILSYGVLMILLLYFLINFKKNALKINNLSLILIILVVTVILGFFAPIDFSNRFLEFLIVPLSIIGGAAIYQLEVLKSKKILERFLYYFLIAILIVNNLTVLRNMAIIKEDEKHYIFIPKTTFSAIRFLDTEQKKDYNAISSATSGNYLPAISPYIRTFYGHVIETQDDKAKAKFILSFYKNEIDENQAQEILEQYNIDFVFYGPQEQKLNPNFDERKYKFLEKNYEKDKVIIYQIK